MNRRLRPAALLGAALAVALLGGCGLHHHRHHDRHHDRHHPPPAGGGDPTAPVVIVVNGNIAVDQPTLRFAKDQVNVRITWRLQGKGGGKLSFPPNGVVFERAAQGEIVECQRNRDHTEFSCLNRHTRPGVYRYGINVDEDGQPLKPLDPFIMND